MSFVRPQRKSEGVAPPADPGEKMALGEPSEVAGLDVFDASFVHNSTGGQFAGVREISEPSGGVVVELIVIRQC